MLISEVCTRVGTAMPDNVLLIPEPQFFVTQSRLATPDGPLRAGATAVVTAHWRELPPPEIGLLRSTRVRRFGETAITFYRREPGGVAAAG
jgi:hypothetical protein